MIYFSIEEFKYLVDDFIKLWNQFRTDKVVSVRII